MKLKLKERELPPAQLRLVVPAKLKGTLEEYIAFVREKSGREVEVREVAVEMLAQFIEADREFKQQQKRGQKPDLQRTLRGGKGAVQVNGQASA
jgi:hypothetical protein